ncbi:helix-turn-helix transcriptional regulator [uncultured Mitsuokella sp.]|uniref:helix-turn-helix domain-containing protein n=1 Tax=uncultured Mitsuokella sp. TaxID=453120 RepID=UPI0025F3A07D|nr:helix-turn-helix transcriptional regulator [uncultured Mitsuokella sp.]
MTATRKVHIWSTRLKELRIQNNLSQAEVAKVIQCSQVAYGMYELGKRKIPIDKLVVLAKYYRVSLDYLAGLCDNVGGLTANM